MTKDGRCGSCAAAGLVVCDEAPFRVSSLRPRSLTRVIDPFDIDECRKRRILPVMVQTRYNFPFELLVELAAAHDSQSLEGTPVERVEDRLKKSIGLARQAGLSGMTLYLERCDMMWLCNARGIDRLSQAAQRMQVEGVSVQRTPKGMESHIRGHRLSAAPSFPVIRDPSLTPGFVQHIPTPGEKLSMLARFQETAQIASLHQFGEGATRQ